MGLARLSKVNISGLPYHKEMWICSAREFDLYSRIIWNNAEQGDEEEDGLEQTFQVLHRPWKSGELLEGG